MQARPGLHLTYCSNIHAGETWSEIFSALQKNIPDIKNSISPHAPFGIGLRLGAAAAKELGTEEAMDAFRSWLGQLDCYVFTLNGFVHGGFHRTVVKDNVYRPGWDETERLNYTAALIHVLEQLISDDSDAGISTSPLSFKAWFKNKEEKREAQLRSCLNLVQCVKMLHELRSNTGKCIHLDIEPEPGCLIETSGEMLQFMKEIMLPFGSSALAADAGLTTSQARQAILDHIRVCYDICHFAVEYEDHEEAIARFSGEGIRIGKVQVSSALKVLTGPGTDRKAVLEQYKRFSESTYLHQTIAKDKNGTLRYFDDLPLALEEFFREEYLEWRTHYHVPVFMPAYAALQSTQEDILKVFAILKRHNFTSHIEVETYTWEVLPPAERLELRDSIIREMKWVLSHLE